MLIKLNKASVSVFTHVLLSVCLICRTVFGGCSRPQFNWNNCAIWQCIVVGSNVNWYTNACKSGNVKTNRRKMQEK